jgi:hypothetical protein
MAIVSNPQIRMRDINIPDMKGKVVSRDFSECWRCGYVAPNAEFKKGDQWSVKVCPHCEVDTANSQAVPIGVLGVCDDKLL